MVNSSINTTRPRVPLRILIRFREGADVRDLARRFAAYRAVILGEAKKDYWKSLWLAGDLEGFAWVQTTEVNDAMAGLRTFPEIVEVRISMRDVDVR
jgi:hypothetical protein